MSADSLRVKPDRETLSAALHGLTREVWDACGDALIRSALRDQVSAQVDAVLALWPGRSEAEVKAEALREWVEDVTGDLAATKAEGIDLGRDYLHGMRSALMQATERADRLAAEGGDDR